MPRSFTATQWLPVEHEIATPATYPPGNTVKGLDHRPDIHVAAAPLSPMTEHSAADTQETEYAPALLKAGMSLGGDQLPLRNVIDSPLMVTAMQNLDAAHETEISPFGAESRLGVHLRPLNAKIWPSKFVATQNLGVEHETLNNRSLSVPVEVVLYVVQECPLNVTKALGFPAISLAPTAAQKVDVGHETLYPSPAGAIGAADDQT